MSNVCPERLHVPLCQPHHLLKHEHPGWLLAQPEPGTFVWTAPTGTRHVVTAEPYQPALGPVTPAQGPMSIPDLVFAPPPRRPAPWTPRRNQHGHLTDAARDTAERLTRATHPDPQTPPGPYDHDPDF